MFKVTPANRGRGLKALRLARSWTQDHVAREGQVSLSTIRAVEGGSRRIAPDTAARIAALFAVPVEFLWPATAEVPGVLVTLETAYQEFAIRDGRRLHARYHGRQRFGQRSEGDRIASSGARRAVEQFHRLAPGELRAHGLDVVSTRNLRTRTVHIREDHAGRVFVVAGPLEGVEQMLDGGDGTWLVFGWIDAGKARTRRPEGDPPAHVWRLDELEPPTDPRSAS